MKLTVRSRAFPNFGQDNRAHFLLAQSAVTCTVSFDTGLATTLTATKVAASAFELDIGLTAVPDRVNPDGTPVMEQGVAAKALITRIELDYRADVTLGGLAFTALRIVQRLQPTPRDAGGRNRVDYLLAPGGWLDASGRQRVANSAVHPLLDASKLTLGEVLLNTLMLDITPGWRQLHRNNRLYQVHDVLSRDRGLTLKVFAHTNGTPFIWYAVIPNQLRGTKPVSPHIFLQPSDNREGQSPASESAYLLNNDRYFESDGMTLMKYLLPPLADVDVPSMGPPLQSPKHLRNVVNFQKATVNGKETGEFTTDHWNIPAGMQKAFEHIGSGVPGQFLLLPQRVGAAASAQSGSYGVAVTGLLPSVTDAVFGLLESSTELTQSGGDVLLKRDKLVISAYSESGFDLWNVSRANQDALKAVIGIEPQNVNSIQNDYRPKDDAGERQGDPPLLGKDVIPELLKRKVQVYIIGRHHLQYGPKITDPSKLHRLPKDPASVFRYPPDPSVNDFIKYRVHRMLVPGDDPFLLPGEAEILAALAMRGISGSAVLPVIFGPKGNQDVSVRDGVSRWYSHHFALSGGDDLQLDASGVYGKPIKYNTWFQVAVHEIG